MIRIARAAGRTRKLAYVPLLAALEDRTLLATLVVDPAGSSGVFTTIQTAVTAANAAGGDTIQIHPATYTEQLTIDKNLTMMSTAPGVIIQSPSTLTPDLGEAPVVEIKGGATVNIYSLTVQGPAPLQTISPGNQAAIDGIYIVGGATANLTGVTINNIRPEPLSGIQTGGRGILVGSTSLSQVGHATITDGTITKYETTGIQTGGNGTTVTVTGTTVTGVGPTSVNGQNGIVIGAGTSATIIDSTISGNQFTGRYSGPNPITAVQAFGILNLGSSSISGNTVTGNDLGIYNRSTGTTISGNTVQDSFAGIFLDEGTTTVSNNTIDGNNIGVAVVAFVGSTANSQGVLLSNNIFNNGNGGLSFPGGGIRLLVQSGATTTVGATAHFNRIVGNSVGLDNTTAAATDATLDWWGSNSGPNTTGNDKTSGGVNTSPWLVLSLSASPTLIGPGGTASVTASVTSDSSGATHLTAPFFPNGIPIALGATGGTMAPASAPTQSGSASSTFTAGPPAIATVSATLDNQTVTRRLHRRQQEADQHHDDRDDDQQAVAFSSDGQRIAAGGTMAPASAPTQSGSASSTFTGSDNHRNRKSG
jgi:parallel beta-helix repeat protein